ncbi:MarR family winged helix-turn-helix transcriptional regulator [Rhodococcus sp. 077-4]|uniref:MarR family winged helix-turn-helix transcriptional regulator n=1 Tax=Rhodococcus sp. 077-4 TaxID=2789271 RepID=UPI0039F5CB7E
MLPSSTELAVGAWEALFRSQVSLMRRFTADDIWDPIGVREYDVLFTLSNSETRALRLHELNEEILLSQPSLSRMCDRLTALGYVARQSDPSDKRGTVICLTEAGAHVQKKIGRRHAARIRRYVGGALNADELETLESLCTKLRLAQTDIEE